MGDTDRREYFKRYRKKNVSKFVHKALKKEKARHIKRLNKLFGRCEINECGECAKIDCPFEDDMHFHYDGCPSCATYLC